MQLHAPKSFRSAWAEISYIFYIIQFKIPWYENRSSTAYYVIPENIKFTKNLFTHVQDAPAELLFTDILLEIH